MFTSKACLCWWIWDQYFDRMQGLYLEEPFSLRLYILIWEWVYWFLKTAVLNAVKSWDEKWCYALYLGKKLNQKFVLLPYLQGKCLVWGILGSCSYLRLSCCPQHVPLLSSELRFLFCPVTVVCNCSAIVLWVLGCNVVGGKKQKQSQMSRVAQRTLSVVWKNRCKVLKIDAEVWFHLFCLQHNL